MGQQSKYTVELDAEICKRISSGEPLRAICRDEHMASAQSVYRWIDEHDDFALRFARARKDGFDAIAEEALDIADDSTADYIDRYNTRTQTVERVLDPEHVQRSKLRVETRLKLLAKWDPKRYGERLEIDGKLQLDVATRIVAARKRVGQ